MNPINLIKDRPFTVYNERSDSLDSSLNLYYFRGLYSFVYHFLDHNVFMVKEILQKLRVGRKHRIYVQILFIVLQTITNKINRPTLTYLLTLIEH